MSLPFDEANLDKLALVIVKTGLNLAPGQDLIITASAEALPLVRRVTAEAYKAGAALVTAILGDEEINRARYQHGSDESFDHAPGWLYNGMAEAYAANAARLHIVADNPMALAAEDPEKVSRAAKANSLAYKPALTKIANFEINWNIAAYPGKAWSQIVFPDLEPAAAQAALADAIFAASRIETDNAAAAWAAHNANLATRRDWLNKQDFASLHFISEHTDLIVGLADGHLWTGGASKAKNGIICNPNIPTEEVFTTPHKDGVNGKVRASKPLAHQGTLIEGIEVTFENGKITKATAEKGEAIFLKLIETDPGARRLGEVALVPFASPISQSNILFYNTLFDENAACHIALGQCYKDCLRASTDASDAEIVARGGNSSLIHVDWMIGAADTQIDGIMQNGDRVPVFRHGNWAT